MHNGFISNFQNIRRSLLAELSESSFNMIAGSTDSELLFGLFLDALKTQSSQGCESMGQALQQAIETVERVNREAGCTDNSLLNLAVTDGYEMAVTRYITDGSAGANTLYHHQGRSYTCVDGVCQMSPAEDAADVVLIASEPLSDHSQWTQVSPNHLLLVNRDLSVRTVGM